METAGTPGGRWGQSGAELWVPAGIPTAPLCPRELSASCSRAPLLRALAHPEGPRSHGETVPWAGGALPSPTLSTGAHPSRPLPGAAVSVTPGPSPASPAVPSPGVLGPCPQPP